METYYVSCKKYTANKNSIVKKWLMLSSNYAVCGQINSTFTKNKELHNCDENKTNKIISIC